MSGDRDYHNTKPCGNYVPLVLLLMPYALVRHGLAQLASRRGDFRRRTRAAR